MASSSHSPKWNKSRAIKRAGHLENWFSGDNDNIEKFMLEISRKVINTPKLLSFNWLKEQNPKEVKKDLKDQKQRRFLEMSRNTYSYLVKVFYTNVLVDGENMYSHVKWVDMEITLVVWNAIIGLKYSGVRINK